MSKRVVVSDKPNAIARRPRTHHIVDLENRAHELSGQKVLLALRDERIENELLLHVCARREQEAQSQPLYDRCRPARDAP